MSKLRRPLFVLILVGVAMVTLAAPSIGDTKRIKAAGAPGNWRWDPTSRAITKGDRVVWKNPTSTGHRVTAFGGNWSKDTAIAAGGGSTSKRFKKTGTFRFRCTVGAGTSTAHSNLSDGTCSGMCGRVRVTN